MSTLRRIDLLTLHCQEVRNTADSPYLRGRQLCKGQNCKIRRTKMYRLIRDTNNMCQPPYVTYHIEKLVRFLWWTWWSREYLADPDGHHWYSDQQEAENCLRIMNGIRPWVVREEVGVR